MINFGRLAVDILEEKVKNIIGEEAIKDIKKPLLDEELRKNILDAAERAENNWIAEYTDKDITSYVQQMPLYDLECVQQALRDLYDNPKSKITHNLLKGKLVLELPQNIDPNRIEKAIAAYLEMLRIEFIGLENFRKKLSAIVAIETTRNTAETVEELKKLNLLVTKLLPIESEIVEPHSTILLENDLKMVIDRIVQYRERRGGKTIIYGTTKDKNGIIFFGEGQNIQITLENHSAIPIVIFSVDIIISNYKDILTEDYDYQKMETTTPFLELPNTTYNTPLIFSDLSNTGTVIPVNDKRFGLEAKGSFSSQHTLNFTVLAKRHGLWQYYIQVGFKDVDGKFERQCKSEQFAIVKT